MMTLPHFPALTVRGNPGVIYVPQQYSTIQRAVDAASPGDTIVVSASQSTYSGNISIDKSLTLTGASPTSTVIDAGNIGPGLLINSTSDVQLSGFKIVNASPLDSSIEITSSTNILIQGNIVNSTATNPGNGVLVQDSNLVTLKNNTITGGIYGVLMKGGYSNTIQSNIINKNSAANIHLNNTTGAIVRNNDLTKADRGLDIWYGAGGDSVTLNTMANSSTAGLWIISSSNNQIAANNIDWNNVSSSSYGIKLQSTSGNEFFYNNIRHNSVQMYGVLDSDMTGNIWNDRGTNPKGNYWSDYSGLDNDTDNIGDTKVPWPCPTASGAGSLCSSRPDPGVDYYPLMNSTSFTALNLTLTASPLSGCSIPAPLTVSFDSSVQGGSPPYSYSWKFGDGSSAGNVSSLSHSYTARGELFATLTAIDRLGDSTFDTVIITSFAGGLVLRVLDSSGNSLSGVNVTSTSQPAGLGRQSQDTNSSGYVDFPCLPPGPYKFQASLPNYQLLPISLTVTNSTVRQTVVLQGHNSYSLNLLDYLGIAAAVVVIMAVTVFMWRRRRGSATATAKKD